MVGKVAVPQLFEEFDGGGGGHLGQPHLVGQVGSLVVGVPEHEGGCGKDQQLVVTAAVFGQATLDVGIELLTLLQRPVSREDGIGGRRGELAPVIGVPGLEDHRTPLRAAGDVESTADIEMIVAVGEFTGCRVRQEHAPVFVGDDFVTVPGVEQRVGGGQEALGPLVALVLGQEAAAAEVLAREGIPGGDDVPGGPAVGQVVQRGELPCHFIGFVERRVDRARQPEPICHRGQRGQHREGVRAPDDVEVVDLAALFAQPQSLGQEQEVEFAAFSGLREPDERIEFDVAAGFWVAPHRGVVDPREMCGQMNLLDGLAHGRFLVRVRRSCSGWQGG